MAEEQARNAGILGVLKTSDDAQMDLARSIQARENRNVASMFGRDSALGNDGADVLGGLIGNQIGRAYGVGGLGMVGTARAAVAPARARSASATSGRSARVAATATATARATAAAPAGWAGGARERPTSSRRQANVRGQLDKEIIRRIIRRHINEVKYCYEQELTKQPELGGRIMVQFTIAGVGPGHRVGRCRIRRWATPARRELHRPGGPALGVPVAARRRHRHRVVSVRADAAGAARAQERAAGPGQPVEIVARPIVQALATLTEGADAAHIERISSLLGLRRAVERRGAGVDDRPAGGRRSRRTCSSRACSSAASTTATRSGC